ncbi:transposase (plasmid) [Pseudosulfitobacter pseudonitzschiae]|uniref:Transposase n=1 Tax=Pseudosulfitobacter pseudonitzschiae TaxID=1402135 RepID=A0A221K8H2_9RHOB|nr:transposase [Pseudosulfitobacter pseudonitzschiae]
MSEVAMIGIDLAKRVFQLHGACAIGAVVFRKKLTRIQLLAFMSQQSTCVVAMEACATAHSWGREFEKLGHTVRLIAPNYVKPFVKRQKNDVADAEAIVEAASRPTMPSKLVPTTPRTRLCCARNRKRVSAEYQNSSVRSSDGP